VRADQRGAKIHGPQADEFVQKLNLPPRRIEGCSLYGPPDREFHSKHSDLNLLCVLEKVDAARIEALHAPVERWLRQGHRAPLVFTLDELQRSADVFAIELLDMKTHHRMLHGEDVSQAYCALHYHAIQVERELRTDWLRLRQAF